jgi:hypothetical protein
LGALSFKHRGSVRTMVAFYWLLNPSSDTFAWMTLVCVCLMEQNICTTMVGCMIHWGLYWPQMDGKVVHYSLSLTATLLTCD